MSTEPENLLALIGAQMDAAMSKLEVRLIDRFAGKKDLENLELRVDTLEKDREGVKVISAARWRLINLFFGGLSAGVISALVYLYH